jgi:Ca-activated chloride channel homolog
MTSRPARAPRHARERRARPRIRAAVLSAAVLSAATVLGAGVLRPHADVADNRPCSTAAPALRVAVAPEMATVVADVARELMSADPGRPCLSPVVVAADPAAVAGALATGGTARPDVWIPDSSVWQSRVPRADLELARQSTSVARSPVVVAVSESRAGRLGWLARPTSLDALLPRRSTPAGALRLVLPDPKRSTATAGVLLELRAAAQRRPDARTALASLLRAAQLNGGTPTSLATSLDPARAIAVPTTEQQVWAHNAQRRTQPALGLYPRGTGYDLDYPFVTLTRDPGQRAVARQLLAHLTGDPGRRIIQAAGFRDQRGAGDPRLTAGQQNDERPSARGLALRPANVAAVARDLTAVSAGSRLLAVIDVSGSMAAPVPGTGRSKLELALEAAANGLALYPDDTRVGLWVFATHLSGALDYRELVPTVALGRNPDGVTGRERMAQALTTVRPATHGRTGLYDTALAAVRSVRRTWQPGRANTVVLLTDGANADDGISLNRLVRTLRAEDDPARPVVLVAIAYGAHSDRAALTAMSHATGGQSYESKDPRRIGEVIQDAIGRRTCERAAGPGGTPTC